MDSMKNVVANEAQAGEDLTTIGQFAKDAAWGAMSVAGKALFYAAGTAAIFAVPMGGLLASDYVTGFVSPQHAQYYGSRPVTGFGAEHRQVVDTVIQDMKEYAVSVRTGLEEIAPAAFVREIGAIAPSAAQMRGVQEEAGARLTSLSEMAAQLKAETPTITRDASGLRM